MPARTGLAAAREPEPGASGAGAGAGAGACGAGAGWPGRCWLPCRWLLDDPDDPEELLEPEDPLELDEPFDPVDEAPPPVSGGVGPVGIGGRWSRSCGMSGGGTGA